MDSIRILEDVTECCICRDPLVNPRMLPCVHIFCLKCLQKTAWYANKKSGDTLPCPICRREFLIPNPDFNGLDKKQNLRGQRITATRHIRDRTDRDHDREYFSTGFTERNEKPRRESYKTPMQPMEDVKSLGKDELFKEVAFFYGTRSMGHQTSRLVDYILPVAVVVLAVGLGFFVINKGLRR